jgi:hypothetical protein
MTRGEAMLKLLALGPERQDRLAQITGWGEGATLAVLAALRAAGEIETAANLSVAGGHRLWFVPGVRDGQIQRARRNREARKVRERMVARDKRGAAGRQVANTRRKASTRGEPRAL